MGSRMQTGLLLVVGTIAAAIGWLVLYPADGTESVTEQASKIMADPDMAKGGIILGFGGMIAMLIGLLNIARNMAAAGGAGSSYANIAAVLVMAVVAGFVVGFGLEYGTAEATSAASGVTLMGISVAVGGAMILAVGIALILLGVGIALDKNFHLVVAALAVISGGMLLISSFVDADNLQVVGWIGMMVTTLALGGLTIRAKS